MDSDTIDKEFPRGVVIRSRSEGAGYGSKHCLSLAKRLVAPHVSTAYSSSNDVHLASAIFGLLRL